MNLTRGASVPSAFASGSHGALIVQFLRYRAEAGIIQVISNNASCSLDELASVRAPKQPLFLSVSPFRPLLPSRLSDVLPLQPILRRGGSRQGQGRSEERP